MSILGPVLAGTVICPRMDVALDAYMNYLGMELVSYGHVYRQHAALWGAPALAQAPCAVLASASGAPWLRLVEDLQAGKAEPFRRHGWMALEILVADVDALADSLEHSPFQVVGPPAPLEVSPQVRAAQVIGPAGEVLYLTQVDGEVPPFQLPRARCPIDRLFIPVLSTADRSSALAFYEGISGAEGLRFNTRITAVNRAWNHPLDERHPVATLQLADESLIEIDELPMAVPSSAPSDRLPAGIAVVSFALQGIKEAKLPWLAPPWEMLGPPYSGLGAACRGAAGELAEFIDPGETVQ